MKNDLLTLNSLTTEELKTILDLAEKPVNNSVLQGKKFALLFQKTSLRTRCSFEIAINDLGGFSTYIDWNTANFHKSDLTDEAKVLSLYFDGIITRLGMHNDLELISKATNIPVINAMTDNFHPCQIIADIITIKKHYADLSEPKIVFLGPVTNVTNSLILASKHLGIDVHVCCPPEFSIDQNFTGEFSNISNDPKEALNDADIVYTDAWISICYTGNEKDKIIEQCKPYQLNHETLKFFNKNPKFMHCMPISYEQEVTKEVLTDLDCLHFEQAANRIVAQRALLQWYYGEN